MAWRCGTKVFMRSGAISEQLASVVAGLGTKVALVTDAGLSSTPWPSRVQQALRGGNLPVLCHFTGVEANPRHTTVDALAAQVRASGADVVVALGGGSVMDAAKCAAMLATNDGELLSYEGKNKWSVRPLPLVAVPTTCGTGSEVTYVSVITHEGQRRKLSVKGEQMFPAAAVVDPDVLSSLPPKLVAYTGVDALTHALEATLSGAGTHNPVSDALAEDAAALLLGHLRAAASGGGDQDSRAAVMRASTLAGLAFGSADVGAVHCLSETLGGLFDVPHGLGNAIFLAATLRHHLAVEDGLARSSGRVRAVLGRLAHRCASDAPLHVPPPRRGQEAECFVEAVDKLCADLRIPKYAELKIAEHDLARIVRMSVENGSNGSNPNGPLNADEYLSIMARS